MAQTEDTIICSIDKDLLQIPGKHFNFVKQEFKEVTIENGIKHFYSQMVIGDRSDNIIGINGLGEKKTAKLLDPLNTEEELFDCVRKLYNNDIRFLINGQLLWIWREYKNIWQPMKPLLIGENHTKQEPEVKLESTVMTEEETKQCTEVI